jgi:hypothetical protein
MGLLYLKRLNFGVISLIPKVPSADQITHFWPIALINVIFKFYANDFATRLTPVAHASIHLNQIAFIKGCNILDDIRVLYEILHEAKSTQEQFVISSILLEKNFSSTKEWN